MGEQHAEGDFVAARIGRGAEFRECADQGSIQLELTALIENCSHRGSGDWLGKRGQVEDGLGRNGVNPPTSRNGREKWGTLGTSVVYEAAERFQRDQLAVARDCDGSGGEGPLAMASRRIENAREKTLS